MAIRLDNRRRLHVPFHQSMPKYSWQADTLKYGIALDGDSRYANQALRMDPSRHTYE